MGHTIGIDLGTTFSAAARVGEQGLPEIIPNRDGERLTPSVVLFQGDIPLVGSMAKRSVTASPLDVVQFVKRSMGDPSWRFETAGGTAYRPEEISALILRRLKEDAELVFDGRVTDAVITVPAYFDDAPRRATMDAGRIAGLTVRRVLNEPTAAALAYGLHEETDGTVLVYDLGGGTFDVTVMRVHDGEFEVLATQGDRNLGGFDWDNALMRLLARRFAEAGGPDLLGPDGGPGEEVEGGVEADLREKAEIAKHTLSTVERARVPLAAGGVSRIVTVTRSEFEEVTAGLVGRTRDIAAMVVEDAGLTWSGVDHVVLAGGSTRMPMVPRMLGRATGTEPWSRINPDEVVALGAAVQAWLVDHETEVTGEVQLTGDAAAEAADRLPALVTPTGRPPVVRDVTSQGLGVLALRRDTDVEENAVIIPPNTPIPARRAEVFQTVHDRQHAVDVEVTQGDDTDPAYIRRIGRQTIPIPSYPAGARLELVYAYDLDQTVVIEVNDLQTGRSAGSFTVHNVANMSEAEVARAIRRVGALEVG